MGLGHAVRDDGGAGANEQAEHRLMYLPDAGRCQEITSTPSVSGGGLTKGYAAQEVEFPPVSRADIE
jgi:hypothetical protein